MSGGTFSGHACYMGSVTYSSAVSDPAFDFDTPLSSRLLTIFASDIDDCASSGAEEAVSLAFEGCESPSSSGVGRQHLSDRMS
jgi:hypothetical protein